MFEKASARVRVYCIAAVAMLASNAALADSVLPVDPSTLTTDLLADLVAVGPLIIGAAVAVMGIRWVKALFF